LAGIPHEELVQRVAAGYASESTAQRFSVIYILQRFLM
jgi:hypothetical protein